MSESLNIALVSPAKSAYSETFIQAHREGLAGNVFYLYGGFIPEYADDGTWFKKPFSRKERWLNSIATRLKLREYVDNYTYHIKHFLKNHKIDVLLAEFGPTGVEMQKICQELGIPILVHFHGYDAYSHTVLAHYRKPYQTFLKTVEGIVAVSKDMQKQLTTLGADASRITINPYGINSHFLSNKPNYQSNYFLSVGRFVDKKAPYLTLLAFQQVYKQYPQARLRMAGDGVLLNTCQNLAQQLGLTEAVEFYGVVTHQKVRQLMQESFCFLQHSITALNGDKEGTPVAILEASASALPVISTWHAGIPEAVKHEQTGFLVKEQDVNQMANYMMRLYGNREEAGNLGQAGRLQIKKHYVMERHLTILNNVIREIAKK